MENFEVSNFTNHSEQQLLDRVEDLEIQGEEFLDQIEKLEGIRSALEEKVSAYRCRLKEVTKQMEDIRASSLRKIVVYHNKDNLERRRFILKKRSHIELRQESCISSKKIGESNNLQEKYQQLLEQYMNERDRNEQLFAYLFQEKGNYELDLFMKKDAADTLLEAATVSSQLIQRAEEQSRVIGSDLKDQLNNLLKQESHLPQEIVNNVKYGLRCLEN